MPQLPIWNAVTREQDSGSFSLSGMLCYLPELARELIMYGKKRNSCQSWKKVGIDNNLQLGKNCAMVF
jgi:hypothetical protein